MASRCQPLGESCCFPLIESRAPDFFILSFDELEDLNAVPEREIVTPEMELARVEAQKKASWLNRFRKDKGGSVTSDGSRRGTAMSGTHGKSGASTSREDVSFAGIANGASTSVRKGDYDEHDYDEHDDDELPPRMAGNDSSHAPVPEEEIGPRPSTDSVPISPQDSIAFSSTNPTHDFNIRQIREEIAKDDGSGQLSASSRPLANQGDQINPPIRTSLEALQANMGRLDLNRADTAPMLPTITQLRKEQDALERQEAEYQEQLSAAEAETPIVSATNQDPFNDTRATRHPYFPDSSSASRYSLSNSNPFATSSNTLSFPMYTHTNGFSESAISFGGDDGSISSDGARVDGNAGPFDDHVAMSFPKSLDPWSANEW